jgi:hypothetical protein
MDVHRQTCQACGSREVKNILVRVAGQPQTVFVRCSRCESLVARYKLRDYYHHGKGIESYLRSKGGSAGESGRHVLEEYKRVADEAAAGYRVALEKLKEAGKEL